MVRYTNAQIYLAKVEVRVSLNTTLKFICLTDSTKYKFHCEYLYT